MLNRRIYEDTYPAIWDEERETFRVLTVPDGSGWIDLVIEGPNVKLGLTPRVMPGTFGNVWLYHRFEDALNAAYTWAATGFQGEPYGWWRHPATGRRRVNGDHRQEYFQQ